MNHKKIEFSNPILKDRIEVLEHSEDVLLFRTFLEPNGGQTTLHYHSRLHEKFKIIEGELNVMVNDDEVTLRLGDEQMITPFTRHKFYNKSTEKVVFDVEIAVPRRMLQALQIMYGLVEDGKTNKEGLPKNILHTAIGINMMDAFSPKIPYFLQKIGISILAGLGRLLGIEKMLIKKYGR